MEEDNSGTRKLRWTKTWKKDFQIKFFVVLPLDQDMGRRKLMKKVYLKDKE
jgi:hypothetical protein